MKTLCFFITLFILSCTINAQMPESFKYQAVVRDANGQLISDTDISIKISIIQGNVDGVAVCIEEFSPTTNQHGLVNIEIGSINTVDFVNIDWSDGPYFIKIEMDITGGINYSEYGTSQLLSVPYALYAKNAENVFSGHYYDLIGTPDLSNYDNNVYDDFNGNYNNLSNRPDFSNYDKNVYDDFDGNYNSLSNKPDLSIYLTEEVDSSVTNELQTISKDGLMITLSNGGGVFTDSVLTEAVIDSIVSDKGFATKDMQNQNIINLADPINDKDAATKAYVDMLEKKLIELEAFYFGTYVLTDIDSNTYKTIKIGTQLWMAENLKSTRYANGDAISYITDNSIWNTVDTGSFCYYNNDSLTNADTYGALYNWYTSIDDRNICPSGWHVPTDDEWNTLSNYLEGDDIAGGKLKESGFTHWSSPNTGATDESGFTALPGGFRASDGSFLVINDNAIFWSSTDQSIDMSTYRGLNYYDDNFDESTYNKNGGFSIRCVRD